MTALAPTRNVSDRETAGGATGRGFDVVRIALAAILLAAAGLKAYQLATEPVGGKDIFSFRWSLIAQVEFEILLGVWLLSGLFKRPAWLAALACFAFFCCATLYKALSGAVSCGCFGKIEVSPWYTLVLDVCAVFALLVFPPDAKPAPSGRISRRRLIATGMAAAFVAVPAGVAMGAYHRENGDAQLHHEGPPHAPGVSQKHDAQAKHACQIRHGACFTGLGLQELSTQEMPGTGNYLRHTLLNTLPHMTQSWKGGTIIITH